MREIKFRGLNNETGEWVYGYYTKLVEGIRRFDAIISEIDDELVRFYIHDAKTIGQFTGCEDKNKKEIYEGDVISYCGNQNICTRYERDRPVRLVKWDYISNGFTAGGLNIPKCTLNGSEWEIVGNEYQNPILAERTNP